MQATESRGILVNESTGADEAISRIATAITAFVGRTLRGPVDRPVAVRSFNEFQQVFGGLWQPSPLSYAVEQFFENGGQCALVVRVVNGGAPVTVSLPCGREALTLEALSPGTREVIRASVDYDNITVADEDRFNLVVQRVRGPGSERIEDQEIFQRLSVLPSTARFVATALLESRLVRVRGTVPSARPDRTYRPGSRLPVGYVYANPDGDDGGVLTDYDLIGSAEQRTGLFALRSEEFQFLYVPPPTREQDLGKSVLLVAERLCRDRRAILIVDAPADWGSAEEALRGIRRLEFRSDNALMCFPRILAYDRLRGHYECFPNGGAVAGTIARLDALRSPWQSGPDEEVLLRTGSRPVVVLTDTERQRLANHGVNALQALRSANPQPISLRTLGGGSLGGADGALLTPRRRLLLIMNSIERGTRWALFEACDRDSWRRIARQVDRFLRPLAEQGVLGAGDPADAYYAVCDERVNTEQDRAEHRVNVLVGVRGARGGEYQSFLVTHSRAGSRVKEARGVARPVVRLLADPDRARPAAQPAAEAGSAASVQAGS